SVRPRSLRCAVATPVISTSPAWGRSSRPQMWSSVDLPAPDGATMATSSPPLTVRSADSSTRTWASPSPKCRWTPVSLRCGSLIAERLDRIVLGGAPGWVDRCQNGEPQGQDDDRRHLARIDLGRQRREEEHLGREDANADQLRDEGAQRLGVDGDHEAEYEPDHGP